MSNLLSINNDLSSEQYIIHKLLLLSSMVKDVSLYNGKMGLIIFFAHYFRYTGQQIFDTTCDELLDELNKDIYTMSCVDGFGYGLSGIGWGIEYLIQSGFTDDDSLKICKEIDKKIMKIDPRRMTDFTLDSGMEGILHYVLAHIKGVMVKHSVIPFDKIFLLDLYEKISNILQDTDSSSSIRILCEKYLTFYENKTSLPDYEFKLSLFLDGNVLVEDDLSKSTFGLKNGLAGFLLKKLIAI